MKLPKRRWQWENFTRKWLILHGNKSFVSYGYFGTKESVFRRNEAGCCEDVPLVNELVAAAISQDSCPTIEMNAMNGSCVRFPHETWNFYYPQDFLFSGKLFPVTKRYAFNWRVHKLHSGIFCFNVHVVSWNARLCKGKLCKIINLDEKFSTLDK